MQTEVQRGVFYSTSAEAARKLSGPARAASGRRATGTGRFYRAPRACGSNARPSRGDSAAPGPRLTRRWE